MSRDCAARTDSFPRGARITLDQLENDPYPVYADLRAHEPISWIPALGMYYATSEALVRRILLDDINFTTSSADSLIHKAFGDNVLTVDGALHQTYRRPLQRALMPGAIRGRVETAIEAAVERLVADFPEKGTVELRAVFASRLPVQTILATVGLPLDDEPLLRGWYDDFEAALANFTGDQAVTHRANNALTDLNRYFDAAIERVKRLPERDTLIGALVHAEPHERLKDNAIRSNLGIVFFGGISTVEALILNTIWALGSHSEVRERIRGNPDYIDRVLDETMRWLSPVQSATRHVTADIAVGGVSFRRGDTVNCMLAAANRDPAVFRDPDRFDPDRPCLSRQLGFATGPHHCIGFRLAKAEARVAILALLARAPSLSIDHDRSAPPSGFEFRQPRALSITLGY